MSRLRSLVDRYFGQDSLDWFDRSYLTDWTVVLFIWFLSAVVSASPVYIRSFSPSDVDIQFSHKKNQVSSFVNHSLALFGPLAVIIVFGCIQRSLLIIHHGAIGVCAARGLARLITEILKHNVGRLRPDFLDRCKWDELIQECTGKDQNVLDGRKSFPSGHSSTAFSGMVFLSLWIAGQTAAWCFAVPKAPRSLRSGRMVLFFMTLLPIFWAMHVAVTRIQDHRHHKEDVVVGSLIGILSALVCYLIFWPNPFAPTTFEYSDHGRPRLLYTDGNHRRVDTEFELHQSRLDEEELNAV